MKKTVVILLTAAIVLLAVAPLFAAGLSSGDWPKPRRDAGNRACSPTTAVALPTVEWRADTFGHGVTMSNCSLMGPILDANNIYTVDEGNGPNGYTMAFKRDGSYLWTATDSTGATSVMMAPVWYWNEGGPTLWNDGTSDFVLVGPGANAPSPGTLWWLGAANGRQPAADFMFQGFVAPTQEYVSMESPAVGADGTIYEVMSRYDTFYNGGTIYAIDGMTHTQKWSWGADGTVAGGASLGWHSGPLCVATVNGKNVLIFVGQVDAADTSPNLFAIQDDGTSCSVLWSKHIAPALWAPPALSNDGQTVYVTTEQWQSDNNINLFAFDVATGAQNWAINPHAELCSGPAVGADGTIYLTSTWEEPANRADNSGKLIAVTDNGTSATIKWTMNLDYESDSYFSSPVVTSGNQATIYFGSTSGRTYAVRDLGSDYQILWFKQLPGVGQHNLPIPVIGNDGHVYIHQGQYIYAFRTGYTGPVGISGVVTDNGGTPIQNACVEASAGAFPLADAATNYYAKTDKNGRYVITVPAGTWNVAAWIDGRCSSDPKTVTLATDTSAATADFKLLIAGPNYCVKKTVSTNHTDTGNPPSNAVDGNIGTRFVSLGTGAAISATNPHWLMVDLGADKSVGEAVIKWEAAWAKNFNIQYLSDGVDPTVETNWTTANSAYSTTNGGGGIPINWITWAPKGKTSTYATVIKFQPVSARYWRIYATAPRPAYSTQNISLFEFELRDGLGAGPASGQCTDVKKMNDGANVYMEGKAVTAVPGAGVPDDTFFIEDNNRAGAIRVHFAGLASKNLGASDIVTISGAVAGGTGEKYIEAGAVNISGSTYLVDALGMTNKAASTTEAQGLFVKLWGKVSAGDTTSFNISDGSGAPVKVMCGSLAQPAVDSTVRVRGVVSSDSSGTVLLMRNDPVDWTDASADYQALPFQGPYKYVRDMLVCGPFADEKSLNGDPSVPNTAQEYRLYHDFIADATNDGFTEATIRPSLGEACGTRTWVRSSTGYKGDRDIVDFTKSFPTNNTNCTFYAHVYVWSPVDQYIPMRLGSDDSIRVYVNGANQYELLAGRSVTIGQDLIYVQLLQGMNSILFKVEQGSGDSGLNVQFLDPMAEGGSGYGGANPILGLGYLLNNNSAPAL